MDGSTELQSGTQGTATTNVEITCTPDMGSMGCTLVVETDAVTGVTTAKATGGTVTVMMAGPPAGYRAYMNLSDVLLDVDPLTGDDRPGARDRLGSRLYGDEMDIAADDTVDPPVVGVDNGGGVTSSYTTHEEPGTSGATDPLTGVSDIFVSVTPAVVDPNDEDNTKAVGELNPAASATEHTDTDPAIANPVLVDNDFVITSGRGASFMAGATWDRNPAAEWETTIEGGNPMTHPNRKGGQPHSEIDPPAFHWTYELNDNTEMLAGGRELQLDMRSTFDPDFTMREVRDPPITIARGPNSGGSPDSVGVPWTDIEFDDIGDLTLGAEIELGVANERAGVYQGVRGVFTCVNGTGGGDGSGICRINHHTQGEMNVSEDDTVTFTPYVYSPDTDWLAAGVWLTLPDDEEGDYAIGAFAFGNDPYKPTNSDALTVEGTATYNGQAFGRYAMATDDERNDAKMVGKFEADAVLKADFGTATEMGSITGDLTGFTADGQDVNWDVNFEQATLKQGPNDADPPQPVADNTAVRFNAGASGHADGHGLTGYWNGQFYGTPATGSTGDALQPGSVAGTFGLTTERDAADNFSLTMTGAFGAEKAPAADD